MDRHGLCAATSHTGGRASALGCIAALGWSRIPADVPAVLIDGVGGVRILWTQGDARKHSFGLYYAHLTDGHWLVNDVIAESKMRGVSAQLSNDGMIHVVWVGARGVEYSTASLLAASDPRAWRSPRLLVDGLVSWVELERDVLGTLHLAYAIQDDARVLDRLRAVNR